VSEGTNFDVWAIVELFGHQKIAGRVTEQVIAGQGFVRVDVPAHGEKEGFTRLFGAGAIYSIIPTTQETVTAFMGANRVEPIHPYELDLPKLQKPVIEEEEGTDGQSGF
jgi:hypothetical protein